MLMQCVNIDDFIVTTEVIQVDKSALPKWPDSSKRARPSIVSWSGQKTCFWRAPVHPNTYIGQSPNFLSVKNNLRLLKLSSIVQAW